jgi:hypothetical protein
MAVFYQNGKSVFAVPAANRTSLKSALHHLLEFQEMTSICVLQNTFTGSQRNVTCCPSRLREIITNSQQIRERRERRGPVFAPSRVVRPGRS